MDKLCFKLPAKAMKMIQEMANEELNAVNFYVYLSQCCSQAGLFKAADYFWGESKDERFHHKTWAEYVQARGEELEVEEAAKPEIKFTDLKSGIEAAYKKEIELTEKYDEFCREMKDVDTMTEMEGRNFMNIQKYALESLSKLWSVFEPLSDQEQREMEQTYWDEKMSSPISA